MRITVSTRACALLCLIGACSGPQRDDVEDSAEGFLAPAALGEMERVLAFDRFLLGGQPTESDLRLAAESGVRTVVTLRPRDEDTFDEAALVESLGMRFLRIPCTAATLGESEAARLDETLDERGAGRILVHCSSGNRVGALWALRRVRRDRIPLEDAIREGKEIGLKAPALEAFVREHAK